jgi:hypothetical protein
MSILKAKVIDSTVTTREGVSAKTGKPYKMRSQEIIVELNGEVRRLPITLQDNASPYSAGNYTIDILKHITVGAYGFEFQRFANIELVAVSSANFPPKAANG